MRKIHLLLPPLATPVLLLVMSQRSATSALGSPTETGLFYLDIVRVSFKKNLFFPL